MLWELTTMEKETVGEVRRKGRRRRLSSLGALMLLIAIVGLVVGDFANQRRYQRETERLVKEAKGYIYYESIDQPGKLDNYTFKPSPNGPLEAVLGNDAFRRIRTVRFPWKLPVDDEALDSLARLHGLESLHLRQTFLSDEQCDKVGKLTDLTCLDLYNTPITDVGFARLGRLTKLKRLDAMSFKLTKEATKTMSSFKHLEHLDLSIFTIDDEALLRLSDLKNLRTLYLNDTRVKGFALKTFPKLEYLTVKSSKLNDEGLRTIGKLENLRELTIIWGSYSDQGVRSLAGLKNLDRLHLTEPPITDAGVKALAGLRVGSDLSIMGGPFAEDVWSAFPKTSLSKVSYHPRRPSDPKSEGRIRKAYPGLKVF